MEVCVRTMSESNASPSPNAFGSQESIVTMGRPTIFTSMIENAEDAPAHLYFACTMDV